MTQRAPSGVPGPADPDGSRRVPHEPRGYRAGRVNRKGSVRRPDGSAGSRRGPELSAVPRGGAGGQAGSDDAC